MKRRTFVHTTAGIAASTAFPRRLKAVDEKRGPATVVVDQKNFQFTPETTAIRVGDHVRFLNSVNHAHNVKMPHSGF